MRADCARRILVWLKTECLRGSTLNLNSAVGLKLDNPVPLNPLIKEDVPIDDKLPLRSRGNPYTFVSGSYPPNTHRLLTGSSLHFRCLSTCLIAGAPKTLMCPIFSFSPKKAFERIFSYALMAIWLRVKLAVTTWAIFRILEHRPDPLLKIPIEPLCRRVLFGHVGSRFSCLKTRP